ncbi:MAG: hypothetical protein COA95_00015 [Methylophaga sp.]|nr:MAG: hypothetical protein COA95_00015 [Methylophaga sp.]
MGVSEDRFYKCLSNGGMLTNLVPVYEYVYGIDLVTQYLAVRNNKILIEISTGKKVNEISIVELKEVTAEA